MNLWTTILSSAAAVSAAVYLIRFFGKAIADQKPFADDREWEIELSGIVFLAVFLVVPATIGIAAAWYWRDFGIWSLIIKVLGNSLSQWLLVYTGIGHVVRLLMIFIISIPLIFWSQVLTERVYKKIAVIPRWLTWYWLQISGRKTGLERFLRKMLNTNSSRLWLPLTVVILFYVATLEFLAGNFFWIVIIWAGAFWLIIIAAFDYSLTSIKLPEIDVYTTSSKTPIHGTLIKAGADYLRLRVGDKINIVNKNNVFKFEVDVNNKSQFDINNFMDDTQLLDKVSGGKQVKNMTRSEFLVLVADCINSVDDILPNDAIYNKYLKGLKDNIASGKLPGSKQQMSDDEKLRLLRKLEYIAKISNSKPKTLTEFFA